MASTDPQKPNLLFILSDDQGAWAMGCAGNEEVRTPNLDRLAETGIRFTNFFCASPVCSPARASILTGQIPSQHGVQDFLRAGNSAELEQDGLEIEYLAGRRSYVESLSGAGYDCGLSGKWHLGVAPRAQLGFGFWSAHASGAGDYFRPPMISEGKLHRPEGYVSDLITDNALAYLEDQRAAEAPFSLNVHYTAPHAPWTREHHPEDVFGDYYDNCAFDSVPCEPVHPNQIWKEESAATIGDTPENRRIALSGYFAAIEEMDRNIGRLLDWLEVNGLRENTLVVFNADNGMNMGHHGIWGKGNGTYPFCMYDTAVKVPSLVSRPGHVPQGLVCEHLLSQYDYAPTLLGYLGVEPAWDRPLPGRDFSGLLRGAGIGGEGSVFVVDEYGPTRMVRERRWKYIHHYQLGKCELYDLLNDPGELENLADAPAHAQVRDRLRADLESWCERFVDPRMDGRGSANVGRGQIGLVGSEEYAKPFEDDLRMWWGESGS